MMLRDLKNFVFLVNNHCSEDNHCEFNFNDELNKSETNPQKSQTDLISELLNMIRLTREKQTGKFGVLNQFLLSSPSYLRLSRK